MSDDVQTPSPDRLRHFRSLAEEVRSSAQRISDPERRRSLISMADTYDSLADHIEERIDRAEAKAN